MNFTHTPHPPRTTNSDLYAPKGGVVCFSWEHGENVFVFSVCVDGWRQRNNFRNPAERKQTPQFKNRQKSWTDPSPTGKQAHENDVQFSPPLEERKFKPQWGVTTQLLEWLQYKTPTKPDAARIWGTEPLSCPWWTRKMVAHSGEQVGSSFSS